MSEEDYKNDGVKALLIAMSLLAGLVTYAMLAEPDVSAFSNFATRRFFISAGVALGYPIAGAAAVELCGLMRDLAYSENELEWTIEDKLLFGAFWPLSLVLFFIIYSFLAIIHRLF